MSKKNHKLTRLKTILQTISLEPWLLVASGVLMAHISWLKWPDLVIDFGGTSLYRLAAFGGRCPL